MIAVEEILANRMHEKGLGIYDENGINGNINIGRIPDVVPPDKENLIAVVQTSSFTREIKAKSGAVRPICNIYVKGKRMLETSKKAREIAQSLSEDAYSGQDFIVYQTFIFSEPVLLEIDAKENYIYSMQVIQCINYIE